MGLRNWLKKLERDAGGEMESFQLRDGSFYYFPTDAELYMFCYDCLEAGSAHNWPEPPERLRMVLEAQDPEAALEAIGGKTYDDLFPFDPEILVTERRLEPRSLVVGRDPHDQAIEDLSEP